MDLDNLQLKRKQAFQISILSSKNLLGWFQKCHVLGTVRQILS